MTLLACDNTWVAYGSNPQDFKATKTGTTRSSAKGSAAAALESQIRTYDTNMVKPSFECQCHGGTKSSKNNAGTISVDYKFLGTIPATQRPRRPLKYVYSAAKAGVLFHIKCKRRGGGSHMYVEEQSFWIDEDLLIEYPLGELEAEEPAGEEVEADELEAEELEAEELEGETGQYEIKANLESQLAHLKGEMQILLDTLDSLSKKLARLR